jgi:uncharacterized delta-60 repeat protein
VTPRLSAGDLDTSFGTGGYVLASSGGRSPSDTGEAVEIQPNGKILISGSGAGGFEVIRLLTNGTLDSSFGSAGRALPLSSAASYDMALQPDGGIVLVGFATVTTRTGKKTDTQNDIGLVRLLADGTSDTSFGQGGKVITGISTSSDGTANKSDAALAVAIQADGRIVVGGYTYGGSVRKYDSVLLRYNLNGSLDDGSANDSTPGDSFGTGGMVVTDWGGYDNLVGLAIQSDGKILAAGQFESADSSYYVARYNTNGSLDVSFATGGFLTGGPSSYLLRFTHPLALQQDDRVVLARSDFNGTDYHMGLARYTTTGTPDPSFGEGSGAVTLNLSGTQYAKAVAIQSDEKFVVVGSSQDSIVARLQPDGTLDTGFGSGGIVIHSFSSGTYDNFVDAALHFDGKIVAVGTASIPVGRTTTPAFLIARFQGNSAAPLSASKALTGGTPPIGQSAATGQLEVLVPWTDPYLTQLATDVILSQPKRRGAHRH